MDYMMHKIVNEILSGVLVNYCIVVLNSLRI